MDTSEARPLKRSKAPQGNEKGAMGSKKPPCILEPLFVSAQRGSKNPGFVLGPLSPYAIASLGIAYITPSLTTKSLGFGGFDSSRLLILRGGNSHVRRI